MPDTILTNLPFSAYNGGRFEYLLKEPSAAQLWTFLSDRSNISQMIDAVKQGKPAISPLLAEVEEQFGSFIASERFPDDDVEVMVNNMILQIMEHMGYEHVACGMLRQAMHIKLSGVYRKRTPDTFN